MCGLLGASGKSESKYLIALGCLSERRGSDSAGVAWQSGENLRITKIAQNPLVAYPVTLASSLRHASRYACPVIGHTRAATHGKVNSENAHPFLDKEGKIAWAHNGVITNYQAFGTFEVDSECLIQGIAERSFAKFHGPIGLLWIEGGKLHAFRRTNPLYRGRLGDAIYLASEEQMLRSIGCVKIRSLSEGRVYVFDGDMVEKTTEIPYKPVYAQTELTAYGSYASDSSRWRRAGHWDHILRRWVEDGDEAELFDAEGAPLCEKCQTSPQSLPSFYCKDCIKKNWLEAGKENRYGHY